MAKNTRFVGLDVHAETLLGGAPNGGGRLEPVAVFELAMR
jgi:hypothetical protein